MSNIFGNKDKFAIEYELEDDAKVENNIVGESFGELALWICGNNICEYSYEGKKYNYNWELYYIIEWLCESITDMLRYDPFPLPVEGGNLNELVKNANEFESGDEVENLLWTFSLNDWLYRHSWLSCKGGAPLSCVSFRRVDSIIELSWDNYFYEKDGVKFSYPLGHHNIQIVEFKEIVLSFLYSIIEELETKAHDNQIVEKWKSMLQVFQ